MKAKWRGRVQTVCNWILERDSTGGAGGKGKGGWIPGWEYQLDEFIFDFCDVGWRKWGRWCPDWCNWTRAGVPAPSTQVTRWDSEGCSAVPAIPPTPSTPTRPNRPRWTWLPLALLLFILLPAARLRHPPPSPASARFCLPLTADEGR